MRILLVNRTAYPTIGGVENSLRFIGRELLVAGHEVKIFCFQTAHNQKLRMEHDGIEIIRVPYTLCRWPHAQALSAVETTRKNIPTLIDEFQPDVIWSRSAPVGLGVIRTGFEGPLLQIFSTNAKMNCRGIFLQTHGLPMQRRLMLLGLWPSSYLTLVSLERELIAHCTAVTFSENMRKQLITVFPQVDYPCHVIAPGVDCDIFSPDQGVRYSNWIENNYGLRRDDSIILYVGRLTLSKQLYLLIDAFVSLKHKCKLVLIGSGPDELRLKEYVGKTGLADSVIFAGAQYETLPGFYALSKVSVLPSTIESFGQAHLESLASGTPAVGFAGDGRRVLTATEEIIRDGQTGGVARDITASALSEKIDSILSLSEGEYALMSKRAREDVKKRFSWHRFVKETLKLSTT